MGQALVRSLIAGIGSRPIGSALQVLAALVTGFGILAGSAKASSLSASDVHNLSLALFTERGPKLPKVIDRLTATGDKSLIPTFVLAMRWSGDNVHIAKGLTELTGHPIANWHDAYQWQEAHPEITPHETFRTLKLQFIGNTDKRFLNFLEDQPMTIRFEEIVWGGVLVDGIPSLDQPKMVPASQATYLLESDLVFGVEIDGDVRAYPLRVMGWHEMMNDVIGGVPVALTYCTLCGAGILYETSVEGRDEPLVFGTSGLLYRSNKLMFDRQTRSLWNQFTGRPVSGALLENRIELIQRPMRITRWADWRAKHPETTVLSLETGYLRDYGSGVTYRDYFASPELMFPARIGDEAHAQRKDHVFGLQVFGGAKAWRLEAFRRNRVINDNVGAEAVVLIGETESRTVRAYQRGAHAFRADPEDTESLLGPAGRWHITPAFLISQDGRKLPRLPGRISYWFAWDNFLGFQSELYSADD